jgi:hypothetical protein
MFRDAVYCFGGLCEYVEIWVLISYSVGEDYQHFGGSSGPLSYESNFRPIACLIEAQTCYLTDRCIVRCGDDYE